MITPFLTGLGVGFSLILAIGAQNAFVLRQGLKGEHIFWVCLLCAVSDAALILAGVAGFHVITRKVAWLVPLMRYGGAFFLFFYGARSFIKALSSSASLQPDKRSPRSLWSILSVCLALTWLNPHVYLDTMVLIGSISTQFPSQQHVFAAGAITASFVFFFILGYSARFLRPVFAKPLSWKILEILIGVIMWGIALKLVLE